jgi:hypothetical protein
LSLQGDAVGQFWRQRSLGEQLGAEPAVRLRRSQPETSLDSAAFKDVWVIAGLDEQL